MLEEDNIYFIFFLHGKEKKTRARKLELEQREIIYISLLKSQVEGEQFLCYDELRNYKSIARNCQKQGA